MKHRRKRSRRKQSKNVSYACYQPRAGGNGKGRVKPKDRVMREKTDAA